MAVILATLTSSYYYSNVAGSDGQNNERCLVVVFLFCFAQSCGGSWEQAPV